MLKNSHGGTQKFISLSDLRNLNIPLPPVSEQKRIAAVLDQAYDLVNLRQKALDKLNTLGPSIFHEMFGDLRTNSKNYPRCKLGELIKVNSGQGLQQKTWYQVIFLFTVEMELMVITMKAPFRRDAYLGGLEYVACSAIVYSKQDVG